MEAEEEAPKVWVEAAGVVPKVRAEVAGVVPKVWVAAGEDPMAREGEAAGVVWAARVGGLNFYYLCKLLHYQKEYNTVDFLNP